MNSLTPTGSAAFNTANNRLTAQNYDFRGNQTSMSPYTMAYAGDDHLKSVASANESASYQYDSDGQRVVKMTCSNPTPCTGSSSSLVTTTYVYDATGELAAEYSTQPASGGTEYYTADHLGSTRLVTDTGGSAKRRYDYLPFGEELFAGTNGRSSLYPAAPPNTPAQGGMLYTGQIRDSETGLDFFEARYFSGPQARFTSPDGPFNDQDAGDPQSWSLYNYVRNNPLNGTDPDGTTTCDANGNNCTDTVTVTGDAGSIPYGYDPSLWRVQHGLQSAVSSVSQAVQNFAQAAVGGLRRINWNCVGAAARNGFHGAFLGFMVGSAVALATGPAAPVTETPFALVRSMGGGAAAFSGSITMCTVANGDGGGGAEKTQHGEQRISERNMSEAEYAEAKTGQQYTQSDGATAYVKKLASGRYNVVVEGEGGTVTVLKNKTSAEVRQLAKIYGWY